MTTVAFQRYLYDVAGVRPVGFNVAALIATVTGQAAVGLGQSAGRKLRAGLAVDAAIPYGRRGTWDPHQ